MRIAVLSTVLVLLAGIASANSGILAAVNAERQANGRAALSYDSKLEAAAAAHAKDMARHGFMSHTGSDGSDLAKRLKRAGYKYCFGAENVAFGQQSLPAVMTAWMNSSGHRKNILNRKATSVGLARATGDRWVMVLGAPC
mmetsp:Transcript_23745/g.42569  ORF Transcript_23745/g.42569 Transcript_23745/m.42569 type:complete len:141 (-) Transcript_23745:1369-1791(-)